MKKIKSRGFLLLESTFGITILAVCIAGMGVMLSGLNNAVKSYENTEWSHQRLVKQRLATQLSRYHKFADVM